HEAVNHVVRIEVESGHRAIRSNAVSVRTLEGSGARARNIELNELAVLIAHETMTHICRVNIPSRDPSICVDSKRVSTLQGTRDVTGVRSIKRGDGAIPIPQEPVTHIVRIKIVSHDGSIWSK